MQSGNLLSAGGAKLTEADLPPEGLPVYCAQAGVSRYALWTTVPQVLRGQLPGQGFVLTDSEYVPIIPRQAVYANELLRMSGYRTLGGWLSRVKIGRQIGSVPQGSLTRTFLKALGHEPGLIQKPPKMEILNWASLDMLLKLPKEGVPVYCSMNGSTQHALWTTVALVLQGQRPGNGFLLTDADYLPLQPLKRVCANQLLIMGGGQKGASWRGRIKLGRDCLGVRVDSIAQTFLRAMGYKPDVGPPKRRRGEAQLGASTANDQAGAEAADDLDDDGEGLVDGDDDDGEQELDGWSEEREGEGLSMEEAAAHALQALNPGRPSLKNEQEAQHLQQPVHTAQAHHRMSKVAVPPAVHYQPNLLPYKRLHTLPPVAHHQAVQANQASRAAEQAQASAKRQRTMDTPPPQQQRQPGMQQVQHRVQQPKQTYPPVQGGTQGQPTVAGRQPAHISTLPRHLSSFGILPHQPGPLSRSPRQPAPRPVVKMDLSQAPALPPLQLEQTEDGQSVLKNETEVLAALMGLLRVLDQGKARVQLVQRYRDEYTYGYKGVLTLSLHYKFLQTALDSGSVPRMLDVFRDQFGLDIRYSGCHL